MWYSGKYDRAFKEVMLKEENHDILKLILEKIINIKIEEMQILNSERLKDNLHIKGQRLDIILKTNIGKINVEVNANNKEYVHYRNLAYLCDIYTHDILVGKEYDGNMKYIQVNLSYELGKKNGKINKYMVKNEKGKIYADNFIIYEVNMDYYMDLWYNEKEKEVEENIIIVMIGLEQKELKRLSEKDAVVKRYMKELDRVNEEPEFREYMSYEEDQRKITNSLISEGIKEGMEKGKQETSIKIATKLLEKGTTIEEVMDITGLSKEEIEQIQSSD